MWFADIYCDFEWVRGQNGHLGSPRMKLRGGRSVSLGVTFEFYFFGDDHAVRHVRALIDTDDHEVADACVDLNIHTWVNALEAAVMLDTGRSFHVERVPGTQTFATAMSKGDADAPVMVLDYELKPAPKVDYQRLAYAFATWGRETRYLLFYFRRLIDESLPLDVRWLNGYRLLEWHFVERRAGLYRSPAWRAFVARFDQELLQVARPGQSGARLLEEARALAAHAGVDDRPEAQRRLEPLNVMEKTFRVIERMVMTVLNEHPARAAHTVRFEAKT